MQETEEEYIDGGGKTSRLGSSRPLQVWRHFGTHDGRLLSAGLAYQVIFSLFAGTWFTFSAMGILFQNHPAVQRALVEGSNDLLPGLIGDSGAIIPTSALLHANATLGLSSVISFIVLLYTTTGFVNAVRGGLRQMLDLPANPRSSGAQAIRDLPVVLGLVIVLTATAFISVEVGTVQTWLFNASGVAQPKWYITFVPPIIAFLIVSLLACGLLSACLRWIAGFKLSMKRFLPTVLVFGLALGLLQSLGSGLLLLPKENPIFASFAVIFGLLIYFNLVCTIMLYCAAWLSFRTPEAIE